MKKALIIFAHPNLQSYNGKMRNVAIQTLENLGFEVNTTDLYQINFKAAADANDFKQLVNPDYFDLQAEQLAAAQNNTFSDDIRAHHDLLRAADLIIFQFPLWWHSIPALLKGYIDRVFAYGFAYGSRGQQLAGKTVLVATTTGAPEQAWLPETRGTIQLIFNHLFIGTFALCKMKALPPFVVYGAKRLSDADKIAELERYQTHLQQVATRL